ncbi:MAG: UxaA family hydrolase [Fusobacteriaceae bacterium]
MKKYIKINEKDNVIVALKDIKKGENIAGIIVKQDIPSGHKIALREIKINENIIKYGYSIGHATKNIEVGEWIHTDNLKTNLSDIIDYKYILKLEDKKSYLEDKKINIYRRWNGDTGIRNELWIIPTVGCVNGIAKLAVEEFMKENDLRGIDGINILSHEYGCSQMGEDHENTKKILQNLVKHPNAGGVIVFGLGCENNQVGIFRDTLGEYNKERTRFLIAQDVNDEVEELKKLLMELYLKMREDKRVEGKLSEINFGLECGGSDGLSGITANPMLGNFSDYIIENGGVTVLTEVPEMFGSETLLMERCENEEIFQKTVKLINEFKNNFKTHGQVIYENPSPGNKKGGISTLEDKSLGCTQKSGTTKIVDVLMYGEMIKKKGLNLLSAPGNDLVATSALGAAKCHLVLFTTGRGNPYGGFIPTVKISTNSKLGNMKKRWIDFDAGRLISENLTMEELLKEFIEYVVDVINGKKCNNELNNFKGLAILKTGVTL